MCKNRICSHFEKDIFYFSRTYKVEDIVNACAWVLLFEGYEDVSMSEERLLPTSDLGFRKAFSTVGKEHILKGFLQDVFNADTKERNIVSVHVSNPYNIIDVNQLSDDEREALLLHTELDIHCIVDDCEIAIEMQVEEVKYMEERIFNNSALKYIAKYDRIFYKNGEPRKVDKQKKQSKYSGFIPIVSFNIFRYHHFRESQKALHFFRLYDKEDDKYTLNPDRYTEIYLELKKDDVNLSKNLKAWQQFMLTGEAMPDSPSYIKEAVDMLKISNLTTEERKQYDIYKRNMQKMWCREAYVFDQGIEKNKIETAKRFLSMGLSIEDVAKGADLDYNTVCNLA